MVSSSRTPLTQLMVIKSQDGGLADMGGVFQVENCVKVFQACWRLLRNKLKPQVNSNPNHSILRFIVDANDLQNKRKWCSQKASLIARFNGTTTTTTIPKHHLNYQNGAGSNTLHATTTTTVTTISSRNSIKQQNGQLEFRMNHGRAEAEAEEQYLDTDEEAEQIMAGYNVDVVASSSSKKQQQHQQKKKQPGGSLKKRRSDARKAEKEAKRRKSDEQHQAKPNTTTTTPERFPPLGLILSEKSQPQKSQPQKKSSKTTVVVDPTKLTMCQVMLLPVEKICVETGHVLERFETVGAAQSSVSPSKNHRKFYKLLKGCHKGGSRIYCGYFWRLHGSDQFKNGQQDTFSFHS